MVCRLHDFLLDGYSCVSDVKEDVGEDDEEDTEARPRVRVRAEAAAAEAARPVLSKFIRRRLPRTDGQLLTLACACTPRHKISIIRPSKVSKISFAARGAFTT